MIGPGINLLQVAVNQASGFSPLSLFASGEEGAWYDPSDLSTLFQDEAGTVPVTAGGQPVRLILDKSGRNNHAPAPSDAARPVLVRAPLGGVRNQLLRSADLTDEVQWTSGSSVRTNGGAWEQGIKCVVASGGVDFHRAIAAVTNRPASVTGNTWHFRILYEAGTSGRIGFYLDGTGPLVFATGPVGALGSGSLSNIVNTDLGGGRYLFTCSRTATADGSITVGVGPHSAVTGENVVILGIQAERDSLTPFQIVGSSLLEVTEAGVQTLSWLEFDGVDDGLHFLYGATIGTPATLGVTASVGWAIKAGVASARVLSHNFGSLFPGFLARGANTNTGSQYSAIQTNFGLVPNALDPFVFTSWSTALVDVETRAYGNVYGAETIGTSTNSALSTEIIDRHSLGSRIDGVTSGDGGLLYGACVRFAPSTDEEASQLTSYMLAKAGIT